MINNSVTEQINEYYKQTFGFSDELISLVYECEDELAEAFDHQEKVAEYWQARVLRAFQEARISDTHFAWNTGYGHNDLGREKTEEVFAGVFGAEKALVRTNIVNGTHAIALALLGVLKPGNGLIYCTGTPYDTMQTVIGTAGSSGKNGEPVQGTLLEQGVKYAEVPLDENDGIDIEALRAAFDGSTRMIAVQRSMGYGFRNCITVNQIEKVVKLAAEESHRQNRSPEDRILVMVDNCYCEFVSFDDIGASGADIICGSLIKNPGGGIALSGGYICGKEALIDQISYRLTCPGIGAECGLTFGQTRPMLQGLFVSPRVSEGAVKGAMLCGKVMEKLGYEVCPAGNALRSDIIQAVRIGSPEGLSAFCLGIQKAAPVDSHVVPVGDEMPGYDDPVIMAAGTFVQGSSIELSCDGPVREPYTAYFQGGLSYAHSKIGLMTAVKELLC